MLLIVGCQVHGGAGSIFTKQTDRDIGLCQQKR